MQKLSKAVKLNQQTHFDKKHLCCIKGTVFFTAYLQLTIPAYTEKQLLKKGLLSAFAKAGITQDVKIGYFLYGASERILNSFDESLGHLA